MSMRNRCVIGAAYGAILILGAGFALIIFRRPEPARDPDGGFVPTGYSPPDLPTLNIAMRWSLPNDLAVS